MNLVVYCFSRTSSAPAFFFKLKLPWFRCRADYQFSCQEASNIFTPLLSRLGLKTRPPHDFALFNSAKSGGGRYFRTSWISSLAVFSRKKERKKWSYKSNISKKERNLFELNFHDVSKKKKPQLQRTKIAHLLTSLVPKLISILKLPRCHGWLTNQFNTSHWFILKGIFVLETWMFSTKKGIIYHISNISQKERNLLEIKRNDS